jgi:hypothetical protein
MNESYRYEGFEITVGNCFLYEMNVYKVASNNINCLLSKYLKANKVLKINKSVKVFSNFKIIKCLTLLEAPKTFIEDNCLPKYELLKRNKNEKRKDIHKTQS